MTADLHDGAGLSDCIFYMEKAIGDQSGECSKVNRPVDLPMIHWSYAKTLTVRETTAWGPQTHQKPSNWQALDFGGATNAANVRNNFATRKSGAS